MVRFSCHDVSCAMARRGVRQSPACVGMVTRSERPRSLIEDGLSVVIVVAVVVCRAVTADGVGEATWVNALSSAHDAQAGHLGLWTVRQTQGEQGGEKCQQDAGCHWSQTRWVIYHSHAAALDEIISSISLSSQTIRPAAETITWRRYYWFYLVLL